MVKIAPKVEALPVKVDVAQIKVEVAPRPKIQVAEKPKKVEEVKPITDE